MEVRFCIKEAFCPPIVFFLPFSNYIWLISPLPLPSFRHISPTLRGGGKGGRGVESSVITQQVKSTWPERTTFHYCWRVKVVSWLVWMESTSPCSSPWLATRWLGAAAHWSDPYLFSKKQFWVPLRRRDKSSFRLPSLVERKKMFCPRRFQEIPCL